MIRRLLIAPVILLGTSLAAPSVGHAQTFKVEKFDIKGEGGTDYVAVEAATGRVFVSRATHMMIVDGATGKVVGDIPKHARRARCGDRHQGRSRLHDQQWRSERHHVRSQDAGGN